MLLLLILEVPGGAIITGCVMREAELLREKESGMEELREMGLGEDTLPHLLLTLSRRSTNTCRTLMEVSRPIRSV